MNGGSAYMALWMLRKRRHDEPQMTWLQAALCVLSGFAIAGLLLLAMSLLCAPAQAVDYPIAAIRVPRYGDGTQPGDRSIVVPEIESPVRAQPGAQLIIRDPGATTDRVVFSAGPNGGIVDPKYSLDGQWIYFAWVKDARIYDRWLTYSGSDIYKINVTTGELIQLTHGEFTPNRGVANWEPDPASGALPWQNGTRGLAQHIHNTGPCPLPGGRLMFTSSRNGHTTQDAHTSHNMQLFVMDDDGRNVEQVGYLNLGSALHPTLLKDGRVMWSSAEAQGHRNGIHWSLWASKPDGRTWEPLISEMTPSGGPSGFHFQAQWADGDIAAVQYYNSNNWGFGEMYGVPSGTASAPTVGGSVFGHPNAALNPPMSSKFKHSFAFQRYGMWSVTPWTNHDDLPAPGNVGKVSMPAAAPGNQLLINYSPGPVSNTGPRPTPWLHSKVGLIGKTTTSPSDIEIVLESPDYHYLQPQAGVPWEAIYGTPPVELPETPHEGHPMLPKGSPFGLVGTSSFYKRETATVNDNSAWIGQGTGPEFDSALMDKVRILYMEPTSHFRDGRQFTAVGNERLRVAGEVSLRKAAGILDADGNPDTSFLARILADTPFTFQLIGTDGLALTTAQTWHQLRPGEVRFDCNGCHAHHQPATRFEGTAASKPDYSIADLTVNTTWTREWKRDVWPIMQAKCVSCHGQGQEAPHIHEHFQIGDGRSTQATKYAFGYDARHSSMYTKMAEGHGNATAEEVLKMGQWIDLGCQIDLVPANEPRGGNGVFADDNRPTLFLDSPRRKEAQPLTVIRFGAADYQNPVGPLSVKASWPVNGLPAETQLMGLFTESDHVWELPLDTPFIGEGRITIICPDATGNEQRVVRHFHASGEPPPPPPLTAVYLGRDGDMLGDVRNTQPDGRLDHHVRLTNLRPGWDEMNVHDGPTKWSNRSGAEGTPDEFWLARVFPNAAGTHDLWFSPRDIPVQPTQFSITVLYYQTGEQVRVVTTYTPPPPAEMASVRVEQGGKVFEGTIPKKP